MNMTNLELADVFLLSIYILLMLDSESYESFYELFMYGDVKFLRIISTTAKYLLKTKPKSEKNAL